MIGIIGWIRTESASATCVAGALAPDNLPGMATAAEGATVVFAIDGTARGAGTATGGDYLMNLAMAEVVCSLGGRPERYDASGRMT